MWGTKYVAAPPQQHQGNVSICNNYELKQLLNVTDRDKLGRNNHIRVSCTP